MRLPGAIVAYKILCFWVAFVQLGLIALGVYVIRFVPPADADPEMIQKISIFPALGATLILIALVFFLGQIYAATASPKPWHWVLGVTNIIGALLFCPISWVLLFHWYRPEVKAYYDPTARYIH